jgi:hypothetical protein
VTDWDRVSDEQATIDRALAETTREVDAPTHEKLPPGPLSYRERCAWASGYEAACAAIRAALDEEQP